MRMQCECSWDTTLLLDSSDRLVEYGASAHSYSERVHSDLSAHRGYKDVLTYRSSIRA